METLENKVRLEISSILGKAEIKHSAEDIQEIINTTNRFYDQGYEFTYNEVASFLASEKNKKYIEEVGLKKVLEGMRYMKLGTIVKKKEPSRNDKCVCKSGKKYKHCCLRK